jgi:alkylhydroperoxidase family enzyme
MPRIPYLPEDITEPRELVAAFRARRGGQLNEADRTVLHAPRLARGWNEIARTVRHELGLPDKIRELAIIGIGVLNGSPFEVQKHTPEFLKGGGTQAQLKALERFDEAAENTELFDALERAVMKLTIEMTRNVQVSDATFAQAQRQLGSNEAVVEMVGTIAMYNMVARFLTALQVE